MRTRMIAVAVAVLAAGCATKVGPAGGGGASVDPSTSVTEQAATSEPGESEDDHGLPRPSELATDLGRQPSGPVDVEVVDGVAVALEPTDPEMQAADYDGLGLTIDAIFTQIADAIQSGDVDVSYDPDLGYPTWAFLDYIVDGADDEMEYVVSSLAPTG